MMLGCNKKIAAEQAAIFLLQRMLNYRRGEARGF
jgi:hypothetical protein